MYIILALGSLTIRNKFQSAQYTSSKKLGYKEENSKFSIN